MEDIRLDTNVADYLILVIYFVAVLGIGFAARRVIKTSLDYFLSGRSLPAWITGLAFISANLGALEILGMAANGAQFGVATVHYYWIGAVPAMVFLGIVMMPFYYGSKVRSVPEYLRLRFNRPTHLFNALSFAFATVLIAGVNLYALALVLELLLGWPILLGIVVAAAIVLVYITLGGLSSAIYNEVLQFFIILAALVPLALVGLHDVGGWDGLREAVRGTEGGEGLLHAWKGTGVGNVTNPLEASWVPIVFGLGFVLSFGYWTTNFAEVQRALSAKSLGAAQRTPLIGAYPKIFIPFITVIPGLVALIVIPGLGSDKPNMEYNNAIPLLMNEYLPNGMLGLALVGLIAAFMAGVAANVSAFNTVVTYDLWEPYVRSGESDQYYIGFGRIATVVRHRHRHRHGADRLGLQQHHGLHPAVVLVLQRAVVRHVHHRHVLAADDAVGGLLGPARRHPRRRRRALRARVGHLEPGLRPGRGVLGRDRRVRRGRPRDGHRDVHDHAKAGRGAAGPGLRHGQRGRGPGSLRARVVPAPVAAGLRRARSRHRPEHRLHLAFKGARPCPIPIRPEIRSSPSTRRRRWTPTGRPTCSTCAA